jgi:hypothetical protein
VLFFEDGKALAKLEWMPSIDNREKRTEERTFNMLTQMVVKE